MSTRPGVRGPIYIIIIGVLSVTGYLFYRDVFFESDFEKTYFSEHRFNRLLRTCEEGKSNQCNRLAMAYEEGHGTDENFELAFQAFEKACELGGFFGCYNVGRHYLNGIYPEVDNRKALEFFRIACNERKHPWSCIEASTLSATSKDEEIFSPRAALEFTTRGCSIGLARACVLKAKLVEEGRVKLPADPKESARMKTRAAEVMENACTTMHYPSDCVMYWERRLSSPNSDFDTSLLRRAIASCKEAPKVHCETYLVMGERYGLYDTKGDTFSFLERDCLILAAACFLRGKIAEEANDLSAAQSYYERACEKDRLIGCRESMRLRAASAE